MTASRPQTRASALVAHLQELAAREDRGALAALRRGLGKDPGTVPEMYPHVEPYLQGASKLETEAAYLVASLFGLHPVAWDPAAAHPWNTSFGWSLHSIRFRTDGSEDEGVARRLLATLSGGAEALPTHLRQMLSLLHSRQDTAPIDWVQLYWDALRWEEVDHRVQRSWAETFWRGGPRQSAEEDSEAPDSEDVATNEQ